MTKVTDVEKAESSPGPGWASDFRTGYLKGGGGGGGGVPGGVANTSDNLLLKSAPGKRGTSGGGGTAEEELKLLGSPSSPDSSSSGKPQIVPGASSGGAGGKEFLRNASKDHDDLVDTSNNATLTFNGLSTLDDHTTTYTATINSLSRFKNRFSSKYGRMRKRVIFKNGDTNLHQTNISKRRRKYLADLFITLVDLQWRWTFLLFAMSFLSSWTCFAAIYWVISYTHGDLEIEHLQDDSWSPCVSNLRGFTSAFLFSIETQTTIGYGSRYTTEECPEAIFMMCIQSILGTIIQAFMVGVVFTKMSRPKKRTETLMFSRHAVINKRDGNLTLQIRVGDLRDQSHIICASIRAQLIRRRQTSEGEILPFYQHELKVGVDSDQQAIFFIWPMIVVHKIDQDSPLFHNTAEELLKEKFEIVVILEGVIESTGATTQARSSYLPSEILWGHRFEPLVSFRKELGEYAVDYSLFNNTYEVDTPRCSAAELQEMQNTEADLTRKGLRILTPFHVSNVEQAGGPGAAARDGKSENAGNKKKASTSVVDTTTTGGGVVAGTASPGISNSST